MIRLSNSCRLDGPLSEERKSLVRRSNVVTLVHAFNAEDSSSISWQG